jgi:hypothetical protein
MQEKIKIPDSYNYVESYLTFRCNFNCSYCINRYGDLKKRIELAPEQWMQALNRLDFGEIPLTLGGGEPTLHKGFYEILNGIKKETTIDLLTNLQFDVDEFLSETTPERFTRNPKPYYHSIRVSYHVESSDKKELIRKAALLQDKGFNIGIFGINHPYYINDNMETGFLCSRVGVPFYVKDFLGEVDGRMYGFYKYPGGLDGKRKSCECKTRELLIAPNGNIHRCHRDLYEDENIIANILDENYEIKEIFRPCNNYGECNPCDVKNKTNRFLKGIDCQVEIINIQQEEISKDF